TSERQTLQAGLQATHNRFNWWPDHSMLFAVSVDGMEVHDLLSANRVAVQFPAPPQRISRGQGAPKALSGFANRDYVTHLRQPSRKWPSRRRIRLSSGK